MSYIGLLAIAGALIVGLLALSDSVRSVAKQMKRQNVLREAELRAGGVAFDAPVEADDD